MYRSVVNRHIADPDRNDIFKIIDDETFEIISSDT